MYLDGRFGSRAFGRRRWYTLYRARAGELAIAKAVNELLDHLLFGHDGLRCLGLTVDLVE